MAKPRKPPGITTSKAPTSPELKTVADFIHYDEMKTLFPMRTNKLIVELGQAEIKEHIARCLSDDHPDYAFLPQRRVHAAKPQRHLRRTLKLDPIAEYYIYDLVFRNKSRFRKPHSTTRTHYGYRFSGGVPIPATEAYKAFRGALSQYSSKYKYSMSFDIASYFNSIYHHDLVSWLAELGAPDNDVEGFGQFLRQIQSGRSIDCLPQGVYPAKMIGNDFLRFVDNYFGLRSAQLIRFMDDIVIFSDNRRDLLDDFELIQRLLGDKGLSINPQKTQEGESAHQSRERDIDSIRRELLKKRRHVITVGYDEAGGGIQKEKLFRFP